MLRLLFCIFCLFISSIASATGSKLLGYTYQGQFTPEAAKTVLMKTPPLDTLQPTHTLNLYKIQYQTKDPSGKSTIASGLVAMPSKPATPVSIVTYMHGTRVNHYDVPSTNNERNYIYLATFGSSAGYMLVMPDYLGFGDSDLTLHPYVESETLATTSIDMLLAAKEFAKSLNYAVNDKLYLAGYSEGGFTTTVTYDELLKHYKNIKITAVSPGSAPYDWRETMRFVVLEPGPRATAYLAYFLYSLQTYHHYWDNMQEIFRKPYDTLIPTLYDGKHQFPDIIAALPNDPRLILQESFYENLMNGTDRNIDALVANFNHYDFKSTSPMLLVGTKGDHDVPYHGSEIAYESYKQKSDTVYIKNVSNTLDHLQAFPYVTMEQLEFFQRY